MSNLKSHQDIGIYPIGLSCLNLCACMVNGPSPWYLELLPCQLTMDEMCPPSWVIRHTNHSKSSSKRGLLVHGRSASSHTWPKEIPVGCLCCQCRVSSGEFLNFKKTSGWFPRSHGLARGKLMQTPPKKAPFGLVLKLCTEAKAAGQFHSLSHNPAPAPPPRTQEKKQSTNQPTKKKTYQQTNK